MGRGDPRPIRPGTTGFTRGISLDSSMAGSTSGPVQEAARMSRIPDFTKVAYGVAEGVRPLADAPAARHADVAARGLTPSDAWLTPEGIAVKKAYSAADT